MSPILEKESSLGVGGKFVRLGERIAYGSMVADGSMPPHRRLALELGSSVEELKVDDAGMYSKYGSSIELWGSSGSCELLSDPDSARQETARVLREITELTIGLR